MKKNNYWQRAMATWGICICGVILGILGLPFIGLGPFAAMDFVNRAIKDIWA
jgi:hypothetical protein